jgi:hypothetical protein
MLGTPSLTAKDTIIGERVQNFRCRQPEGSGSSGKGCPKFHYGHDQPVIGFQHLDPPAEREPADQADGSDDRDGSNHGASSTPRHPKAGPNVCEDQKPLTEGIVTVFAERGLL